MLGAMFNRGAGSNSVTVRMEDASQIAALDKWIRAQPQMQLQAGPLAVIRKAASERTFSRSSAGKVGSVRTPDVPWVESWKSAQTLTDEARRSLTSLILQR